MKEIPYKLLLFFSPFLLISLFTLFVDPYNLFSRAGIIPDEIKVKCLDRNNTVTSRANATWRTFKFKNDPAPNIVLGDSRIAYVSEASLAEKLGSNVSNLAVPASNLGTIIELFWFAAGTTKLQNVIIQVNFNRYSDAIDFDLLSPVRQLISKPYSYFYNITYVKDSFACFWCSMLKNGQSKKTTFKETEDWKRFEKTIMNDFKKYGNVYPENYLKELKKIASYCGKENINLIFVIAPNYHEVRHFVNKSGLDDEYLRFKDDLRSLGKTIDLDCGLPISFEKEMYNDFFHLKPHLADTLVSLIFP